ncbi:beta-lactamase domain-containing protein 2 [Lingula anatina]|uniref:Beta-lactamase domain-containing protein 2 n=1 Tax=Lingula anatina TaxID=7574 RepID=A0A1S3H0P6_LINAN|nr:beta-lactamase domain-containing protein 2 [Lingula anatina]|eukprot:XP_013378744.1 beta-lactamase domain-containing protein 2 [Lingula anatina]
MSSFRQFLSRLAFRRTAIPTEISGYVAPGFEFVEKAFRKNFESGKDIGASFAVYHNGKLAVHLWAGSSDKQTKQPWKENTMSCFFSTTKAMTSLCLAILADRKLIDYKSQVVQYWPEFGQNGKETITVEQLVSHQAGLIEIPTLLSLEILEDHVKLGEIISTLKPSWVPGSCHGYHALTFGWLVDQLVRRVDPNHRSVGQFFQDEVAKPFGIDFYIGLPEHLNSCVASLERENMLDGLTTLMRDQRFRPMLKAMGQGGNSLLWKSLKNLGIAGKMDLHKPEHYSLEVPAANGIGTAKGVAKVFGILSNGGFDRETGKQLLSKEMIDRLLVPLTSGLEKVFMFETNFSLGFATEEFEGRTIFGHSGSGGQGGFADPYYHLGWAYLTRKMMTSPPAQDKSKRDVKDIDQGLEEFMRERGMTDKQ